MELIAKRVNGTQDITPSQSWKWQLIESIASETAEAYGFKQVRIPTFEKTDLFVRSVGDTTDIVQKEMFTVTGKESSFTLRPEGTAGTIRCMIENGMLNEALPQKVYYMLSCFRHERVQAGRLWEFHQFGVEMAGSSSPVADAEVISLAKTLVSRFGLKDVSLNINSIGCPECRAKYYEALRKYFEPHKDKLCGTCLTRFEKNPMRIIDCKSDICQEIAKDAPVILDYLCDECKDHFEQLKSLLEAMDIEYTINPKIVRGLDYYTKTVFELIAGKGDKKGTICGGGRYDGMIEQMGGKPTPALGFGMGLERILMNMEEQGCDFGEPATCDIYIAPMGDAASVKAASLVKTLRDDGYWAETDLMNRVLGKQMKYADKIGSKYVIVLGDNELESGKAKLKNMKTGQQLEIMLDEDFAETFGNILIGDMMEETLQ
ncbi:MAG: histidine--tRNA ligase [Oscillospiraceae bacterium]|nr:histidine--tRNA ligase [Oscillospiraceae bacterium]